MSRACAACNPSRRLFESIRIPPGREVTWRDFDVWFARMRQALQAIGAHRVFEEIPGVIAAQAEGVLTRGAVAIS
jgi:hypothetical protein